MSLFLCKKLQILVANAGFSVINSCTHLGFTQNHLAFTIRLLSAYPDQNQRSYVVSYLVNSCGLSPESAKSVSKRADNADSVLGLLEDYGFVTGHISRLIKKHPRVLMANPRKTLLPKLEFLCSIGISRSDLPGILCRNSDLLQRSLNNTIIPSYNILKSILGFDEEVVKCFKNSYRSDSTKNLAANVASLRRLKAPQQIISYLLTRAPNVVGIYPRKFNEIVNKVIELGLDPSTYAFILAVQLISQTSHKTWEKKMTVYKSWGLSDNEIWLAIKKFPSCMFVSVEKLKCVREFLVNKMGFQPSDVIGYPVIFGYNFEKRIVPRFSVIRVLQLKGFVKADIGIPSVVLNTEKRFLDTYVIKYQGEIPKLFSIYRGEMSIWDLGCEFYTKKH